jgi:hypothetical protein
MLPNDKPASLARQNTDTALPAPLDVKIAISFVITTQQEWALYKETRRRHWCLFYGMEIAKAIKGSGIFYEIITHYNNSMAFWEFLPLHFLATTNLAGLPYFFQATTCLTFLNSE